MHARFTSTFPRVVLFSATLLAAAALPAVARAQQQVSDADRNTARDLYNEGYKLQQQGKYAEALDRYQRSISVYSAPTTAFRIAQCRAALGQLVEAAEELRAVANAQLPAGSPDAFVKAKQEATTELASIEPRIPKLKINVVPANAVGLTVTIDGQPMPTALLGVGRAINPGSHQIVVVAPGYAQQQQTVDVREKQQPPPEVTLTLQAQAGVSYTPSGGGAGGGAGAGGAYGQGGYGQGGYQGPYGGGGRGWVPPERPRGPSTALLLGADLALSVPAGSAPSVGGLNGALGIGVGIGGEVGLRFARIVYLGAMLQGSFFGGDSSTGAAVSIAADGLLGFMSNPDGLGFYGEVGAGYRSLTFSTNTASGTLGGADFIMGLGMQIKAGSFRFIPKANLFVGTLSDQFGNSDVHLFFTLGISAYWELPLSKPQQPAASPAPAY